MKPISAVGTIWKAEEKETLKNSFYTMTVKDIAKLLGRPVEGVKRAATRLGLRRNGDPRYAHRVFLPVWSDQEKQFLAKHYPDYSASEIADAIGRTEKSIFKKAFNMGIKRNKEAKTDLPPLQSFGNLVMPPRAKKPDTPKPAKVDLSWLGAPAGAKIREIRQNVFITVQTVPGGTITTHLAR